MKILFINIDSQTTYPSGIGAVSAFLKRQGHQTKLIELYRSQARLNKEDRGRVREELLGFKPEVVGFTVFETGFHWIKQLCDYVKKINPAVLTVLGGYYPTLAPDEVIKYPTVDIICRGEGEYPMSELVTKLAHKQDPRPIDNLWVKTDGVVRMNPIRPLIENLDELPYWDREMFDFQKHLDDEPKGLRNAKVMASRGCPYNCTYCSNESFKKLYSNPGKYVRMRSVPHLIKEILEVKANYDFDYLGFQDDNLTLYPKWLEEFAELASKHVKIPFYCASRVEHVTDKNVDLLKEAGCFMMLIGVESGNEMFRKNALRRGMTNDDIIKAAARIKSRGIKLWTFNMVGMPNENQWTVLDTVKLNWKIKPDFGMTTVYYPFKGTVMGDHCYNRGYVDEKKKKKVCGYGYRTILNHPNLSWYNMLLAKFLITLPNMKYSFFWKILWSRISGCITRKTRKRRN